MHVFVRFYKCLIIIIIIINLRPLGRRFISAEEREEDERTTEQDVTPYDIHS